VQRSWAADTLPAPGARLRGVVRIGALQDALSRLQLGGVRAVYVVERSGGVRVAEGAARFSSVDPDGPLTPSSPTPPP
jgi:hypothetical protein